jgi:hypothetical protein
MAFDAFTKAHVTTCQYGELKEAGYILARTFQGGGVRLFCIRPFRKG